MTTDSPFTVVIEKTTPIGSWKSEVERSESFVSSQLQLIDAHASTTYIRRSLEHSGYNTEHYNTHGFQIATAAHEGATESAI